MQFFLRSADFPLFLFSVLPKFKNTIQKYWNFVFSSFLEKLQLHACFIQIIDPAMHFTIYKGYKDTLRKKKYQSSCQNSFVLVHWEQMFRNFDLCFNMYLGLFILWSSSGFSFKWRLVNEVIGFKCANWFCINLRNFVGFHLHYFKSWWRGDARASNSFKF